MVAMLLFHLPLSTPLPPSSSVSLVGWLLVCLQEKQPFDRIEVTRQQALEMFGDNPFKVRQGLAKFVLVTII